MPLLSCESSEQEWCLWFDVQNFESHWHTCRLQDFDWRKPLQAAAPALFGLDFLVRGNGPKPQILLEATEIRWTYHWTTSTLRHSWYPFILWQICFKPPKQFHLRLSDSMCWFSKWWEETATVTVVDSPFQTFDAFVSFAEICASVWWLDVHSRCNIHVPMRRHTPSLGLKKAPRGCQTQHLHYQPDPPWWIFSNLIDSFHLKSRETQSTKSYRKNNFQLHYLGFKSAKVTSFSFTTFKEKLEKKTPGSS